MNREASRAGSIAAMVCAGLALLFLAALHVLSPEYSPAWRMVSEYANGRYSWVLSLMFAAYGLSALALAFAIRAEATTRASKARLVLLVLAGAGAASASVFDLNQAILHELSGLLGIVCLPPAAVLISRTLIRREPWAQASTAVLWTAHLTWITVVLFVVSFIVMAATFAHALGGLPSAPPKEVPQGVVALVGWTDRLLVLSAWAWITTVAWIAVRLQKAPSGRATSTASGAKG
jgi:hypothetical membrane protein